MAPGSSFHLTEVFGPVLGIMTASTLDEAIELQNAVPFGLTGGIHSLDDAEVGTWLDRVQVGNAYVNRAVTGAIVQRQSFGGWKRSAVGPGAKAGGPNYVAELGTWGDATSRALGRASGPTAPRPRARDRARGVDRLGTGRRRPLVGSRARRGARPVGAARRVQRVPVPADRGPDGACRGGRRTRRGRARAVRGPHGGVPVVVSRADGPSAVSDAGFAAAVARGEVTGRVRVVGEAPGCARPPRSTSAT
ncbi:aldehyde dehydrogenase family protein [Oerskovia sp. M15]